MQGSAFKFHYIPNAGKDWGQEEKGTTEDEMAGWPHWLDGHEFEYTPGVGDGQGGLTCCDSWGRKEADTTERQNWTEIVRWDQSLLQLSMYRESDRNWSKDSWIPGTALPPTGHHWHHSSPTKCSQPSSHCYLPPFFSWGATCWLQQQTPLPPKFLRLVSSVDPCLLKRIEYNFFRMDYI